MMNQFNAPPEFNKTTGQVFLEGFTSQPTPGITSNPIITTVRQQYRSRVQRKATQVLDKITRYSNSSQQAGKAVVALLTTLFTFFYFRKEIRGIVFLKTKGIYSSNPWRSRIPTSNKFILRNIISKGTIAPYGNGSNHIVTRSEMISSSQASLPNKQDR